NTVGFDTITAPLEFRPQCPQELVASAVRGRYECEEERDVGALPTRAEDVDCRRRAAPGLAPQAHARAPTLRRIGGGSVNVTSSCSVMTSRKCRTYRSGRPL